jgi:hypothetical protein
MNLENLAKTYKIKKVGYPKDAISIADISLNLLDNVQASILNTYNLTDAIYSTKEHVFFDTRRIVASSKYNPKLAQIFSNLDFDYTLNNIVEPVVKRIQEIIPGSVPVLTQLATILPQQNLKWHIDVFLYQQFTNKLHIPIITNSDAFFEVIVDDTVNCINMTRGAIWNINNLALHRSVNRGNTYRTHLIIDVMDENILGYMLETGIDFFHTKLESMSIAEQEIIKKLKAKFNVT